MRQTSIQSSRRCDVTADSRSAAHDFSTVVENHRSQVFRFLLDSLHDVDLAETLTQECFLKAHHNWSTFRGDSSPRTWLTRIAINLQNDHWRSRRRRFWRQATTNSVDIDMARDWLPSGESSPEAQVTARERLGQVWRAVKEMSERRRTVFLLRFVEEMEINEIARVTGLSENTAKTHLYRALKIVRTELGGGK
jgi:RNA polymerase sigma-70 factor, ECF subfamily